MGCMPSGGNQSGVDGGGDVRFQNAKLDVCAVGIVGALQRQDGNLDGRQKAGDVEVLETRVQPGVVPSSERGIHVDMVARQALTQGSGFILGLDLSDADDVQLFDT